MSESFFFKCIALNYFFAFFSLSKQAIPLFGQKGLQPIKPYLQLFKLPTLFRFNASDKAIQWGTYLGILFSLLAFFSIGQSFSFFALWILYLSYVNPGHPFLSFQWDALLLEAGLATIIFSLFPSPWILIYFWILLFRLIFSSGINKILRGSKEWKDLTALKYHYETQPLPNPLSFFLHQMPLWFSKLSTLFVLIVEVGAPFLIFGTEKCRLWGFTLQVILQILIFLTGNFAFFNTLTLALCIPLLITPDFSHGSVTGALLAIPLIVINILYILDLFLPIRASASPLFNALSQWMISSPYGLFVHMTTWRDEIIIEGSEDGKAWLPYEFPYKPQKLNQHPLQIAPLQPRLDWQMWFCSLSYPRRERWFEVLAIRLLEGNPPILSLFTSNPFPNKPPKHIRAALWRYEFTTFKEWKETGNYWKKNFKREILFL